MPLGAFSSLLSKGGWAGVLIELRLLAAAAAATVMLALPQ